MGFFKNMFDPRRTDFGQMTELRKHEGELEMLDDDLHELKEAVREGREDVLQQVTKLEGRVELVRKRLNRVELVTEALFMHLEKQGQIDRAGLREMMEQIDARDGETDGRARKRGT